MILEVSPLRVRSGKTKDFETAFRKSQRFVSTVPGYISHELHRCVENEYLYLLLVRWETLDDRGDVRKAGKYRQWKVMLEQYYERKPTVLHYEPVTGADG